MHTKLLGANYPISEPQPRTADTLPRARPCCAKQQSRKSISNCFPCEVRLEWIFPFKYILMPCLVSYSSRCSAQSKKSVWAYTFIWNHHWTRVGQHRSQKPQFHPSFAILFPTSLPGSHELEIKPDLCFKFSFKPHQYLAPLCTGRPLKHL